MKSPRKKGDKKRKKKKRDENDVLLFVEKAFYELQITDLNRKLARQRARVTELEEKNMQLDGKLNKLDEDRGDIIIYLKRNLSERNTEVADLQSKIANLNESIAKQQEQFDNQLEAFQEEYNFMHEQLTGKVKLLTAQLNVLEDYRLHREEILQKFDQVQNELDEQEIKYKKELYDLGKKAILERANLKREMEGKMFTLATEFQEANQIRIAAASQRIVRENIALNNEMNTLINSTNELDYENAIMKQQFKKAIADYQLLEVGNKKIIRDFAIQAGVIKELTEVNLKQKATIDMYEAALQKGLEDKRKLQELKKNEDNFNNKIRILQNKLNAVRYSEKDLQTLLAAENNFRRHLEIMVNNALLLIKSALFEHPELYQKVKIPGEDNLFTVMLNILTYSKSDILPPSPYGTVSSVSLTQPVSEKDLAQTNCIAEMKPPIRKLNISTYLGASFQDFLNEKSVKSESIETPSGLADLHESDDYSEEISSSTSSDEQACSINNLSNNNLQSRYNIDSCVYICDTEDKTHEDELEEESEKET